MDIKLQTNEQLSVTVANGLSGVFVNGTPLISSIGTKADVSSLTAYYQKSETSSGFQISTELKKYQLSGNYLSSNALNNYYTKTETSSTSQISAEFKKYQLSGNYLSSNALNNYYQKSETSSGSQILTELKKYQLSGNYLSSNALNNYYQKSETSSSSQISTALSSYAKSSDVKNSTITVKQGDVTKGSFTLNQASNYTLSLDSGGGGGGVIFDDRISGFTGENQLSVVKLSADEYAQMLDDGSCLSNALYIVEAPNIDAFKQQIKNVAPPTDLSDAATKEYVDNALTNV